MSHAADPKIIDLLNEKAADEAAETWVALEFFPPRTQQGVENLKKVSLPRRAAALPYALRCLTPPASPHVAGSGGRGHAACPAR